VSGKKVFIVLQRQTRIFQGRYKEKEIKGLSLREKSFELWKYIRNTIDME